MKLWKLSDGQTQWRSGVTQVSTGRGRMGEPDLIYAFPDPMLAVFMNPTAGTTMRLWQCEGEPVFSDGLQIACTNLPIVREVSPPEVTPEMRARFAILVAQLAFRDREWVTWSHAWLSDRERSASASERAARAARAAIAAAARYAACALSSAADVSAATDAGSLALRADAACIAAADAADDARAASAAAFAADAACAASRATNAEEEAYVARVAAYAVRAAMSTSWIAKDATVDLVALARRACGLRRRAPKQ